MSIFEPTYTHGEIAAAIVAAKFKRESRSAKRHEARRRASIMASSAGPNHLGGYMPAVAEARRKRREAQSAIVMTEAEFVYRNQQHLKKAFSEPRTKFESVRRPRRSRDRLDRKVIVGVRVYGKQYGFDGKPVKAAA